MARGRAQICERAALGKRVTETHPLIATPRVSANLICANFLGPRALPPATMASRFQRARLVLFAVHEPAKD